MIVGLTCGLPEKQAHLSLKSPTRAKSSPPARLHPSEKNNWNPDIWCVPLGRNDGRGSKGMKEQVWTTEKGSGTKLKMPFGHPAMKTLFSKISVFILLNELYTQTFRF